MVKLEVTERQAEYLNDILDMWIAGYQDAVKDAERSETIVLYDGPEDMLQMIDDLHWRHADAVDLKLKLMEARRQ
jgi:hypothetical protein